MDIVTISQTFMCTNSQSSVFISIYLYPLPLPSIPTSVSISPSTLFFLLLPSPLVFLFHFPVTAPTFLFLLALVWYCDTVHLWIKMDLRNGLKNTYVHKRCMKGVYWLSLAAQTTEIWSEIFFKQQIPNNQQHATDIYIDSLVSSFN